MHLATAAQAAYQMTSQEVAEENESFGIAPAKPIVLVACCGAKLDHAAPAGEIYRSDLFLKAKAYAEQIGARWMILSAKHGLVDPATIIAPYDETLNDKSADELEDWNSLVRLQLGNDVWNRGGSSAGFVVLAGAKYRGWLTKWDRVEVPMAGMGIGKQKAWLKFMVAA